MPFVIKAVGLVKEWAGKTIFEDVNFEISEGERIALVGPNGIGKTTLVSGLMGTVRFDGGIVQRRYPVEEWGWLEQHLEVDDAITLHEFVQAGNPRLADLKHKIGLLQSLMETRSHGDMETLVEVFSQVHDEYVANSGYEWELANEQMLVRYGFQQESWSTPYMALSGGEKTKAQLVRLLVRQPKVLILDEPTNHLDAGTMVWLEGWLKRFAGTVLFVSHDRYFIDAVADAVLELTPTGAKRYQGGYTAFREQSDVQRRAQQGLYEKQQREKQQLIETIRQYQNWYAQAHDAAGIDFYARKKAQKNSTRFKAKERALERLEARMVDRPQRDAQLQLWFDDGGFEAKSMVSLHDVTFQYGSRRLFQGLNLRIKRGDKVAIVGRNGVGKSTLLGLLTGQLCPNEGSIEVHPALRIGYFTQELGDLDLNLSVLDTVLLMEGMTLSYARTVLAGFMFGADVVSARVGDLSMGERCRVAFVKLYFSGANILVLDEPTNYLDVDSRERIEEALMEYPGALLVVSHDRYLVRKVANRILSIEADEFHGGSKVRDYTGSYDEFMDSHVVDAANLDLDKENQIRQLELQLANDVARETPSDAEENDRLIERIQMTKRKLNELRQG